MQKFKDKLATYKAQGRYRFLDASVSGVDFTSNDYLGFSTHSVLREAAISFFQDEGAIGSGASRLLRGEMGAHMALEAYAADYFNAPAALFFGNGFTANSALMKTLPDRHDVIVFDSLIHASSRDGIQACSAKHVRVAHNDLDAYEVALKKVRSECKGQIWVAVESVYSMDGDFAPLDALHDLCIQYDAVLVVDEAHGVGVCGPGGKGLCEELVMAKGYEYLIVVHTCGKALGVAGGLVCASKDVIEYMVNNARGFIYSTAPMPVQAHLVQKALELSLSDEGAQRRARLQGLCDIGKELFGGVGSHIVPVVIGKDEAALDVAKKMQQSGYDVRAIRPPSVPKGSARLRVSLNADLMEKDLYDFFEVLSLIMKD